MVLEISCVLPIMLAMAKLPVIRYAIKNVALDPVMRQLMVLTMLLRGASITVCLGLATEHVLQWQILSVFLRPDHAV